MMKFSNTKSNPEGMYWVVMGVRGEGLQSRKFLNNATKF